jgi:predicted GNAT family N-acyltransferase
LPVPLIGRLAVHEQLKGQGCGELLLMDALHRCLTHAADIAAMAVVVDAKDDAAAAFYRHFSFLPLQRDARRMYLPMKAVAALLG